MSKQPASQANPIKVVVVDDHPFFRQGVRDVLNTEDDIEVIAESGDGQEALELLQHVRPDVVLMDVNLPTMNGLQVTQKLKSQCPDINVIILTAYDDEEQIYRAIRIGASAYFAKDIEPNHLLNTVRIVSQGYYMIADKRMTPSQAEQWLLERYRRYGLKPEDVTFSPLTDREMEILELIIEGLSNKEIAFRLNISQQTVKNHVTSILAKLNLADRTQAAIYALRHGWVRLPREEEPSTASPYSHGERE
ncbi:MAG: response regulator transcription factor [Anaerolineales bacterium]|nr:response regulator transcription factor [Anaerolineales bacterium]